MKEKLLNIINVIKNEEQDYAEVELEFKDTSYNKAIKEINETIMNIMDNLDFHSLCRFEAYVEDLPDELEYVHLENWEFDGFYLIPEFGKLSIDELDMLNEERNNVYITICVKSED